MGRNVLTPLNLEMIRCELLHYSPLSCFTPLTIRGHYDEVFLPPPGFSKMPGNWFEGRCEVGLWWSLNTGEFYRESVMAGKLGWLLSNARELW